MSIIIERNIPSCVKADALLCCWEAKTVSGGAICDSILRAAGPGLKNEIDQHDGFQAFRIGEAEPYRLCNFKKVLYTVMPHYDGSEKAAVFVSGAYDNAFHYAETAGINSLAVPLHQADRYDVPYEKLLRIVTDAAMNFFNVTKSDMDIILVVNGLSKKAVEDLRYFIDRRFDRDDEGYCEPELNCHVGQLRGIVKEGLQSTATSDEIYCERANISEENLSDFRNMSAINWLTEDVVWNMLLGLRLDEKSIREKISMLDSDYCPDESKWASIILFFASRGIYDISLIDEGLSKYGYRGIREKVVDFFTWLL